ncbi:MAG: hypothetical protein P4L41_16960 [Flavipsychrobacter sp.]|nr:hypothetical protein [Flavipsychrobacter sp.]
MKQVKIFSALDVVTLQYQVNEWLSENKNVDIIETNINSFGTPDANGKKSNEKYTFYIIYSTIPHPVAEAAAILEESLPSSTQMPDMNTDILPHAN